MHEFTMLMVAVLLAIYIVSCVLKRRSLIYLTLIMGVCQSAAVLMDDSLAKNEMLVLALLPQTITLFGTMTLLNGEDRQW